MNKIIIFLSILFCANSAFADLYITENIAGGCTEYEEGLTAYFQPHQHTCNPGYYLPANYDGCVACPADATCAGGTFAFNDTRAQGILYNQITQSVSHGCATNLPLNESSVAIFEPNQHTCNPGYYMPANTDGCIICSADSYCPGGTYTFNETVPQGITACATGLYAPTGLWESAQCGHILHVGNEVVYLHSVKKTAPALHVKMGNDVFYGNMTTADVSMNINANHKLKIKYNNVIYSVYDDTVNVGE